MSIKPTSVPTKSLSQAITSTSVSFKVNNIKGWGHDALGNYVNLTSADFGSQAFCVFRNFSGNVIEIMEFDPATIASASITILNRGLPFDGTSTPVTNYKLDWPAGSIIEFGTDVPQLISALSAGQASALALKADLASPAFTGNPTAPTAASTDSDTTIATTAFVQANKLGYVLTVGMSSTSPVDATTYYGGNNFWRVSVTVAGTMRVYVPKAGTIKSCYLYVKNSGTAGTSETSTINIRLNDMTDTAITSSLVTNASGAFSNTGLAIAVVAGDFLEFKWVTPTWVTNPTNIDIDGVIYIE